MSSRSYDKTPSRLGRTPQYCTMFDKWKPVPLRKLPKLIKELDIELYNQYKNLPTSKRKNYELKLLQQYNEKHPLYFPL